MDGHTIPDCKGKWVDITTLSDPVPQEKCVVCRAVRVRRSEDDDQGPLPPLIPDQDEETDEDEEAFRRYMRQANQEVQGSRVFIGYAVVFLMGAITTGIVCGLWWLRHH